LTESETQQSEIVKLEIRRNPRSTAEKEKKEENVGNEGISGRKQKKIVLMTQSKPPKKKLCIVGGATAATGKTRPSERMNDYRGSKQKHLMERGWEGTGRKMTASPKKEK